MLSILAYSMLIGGLVATIFGRSHYLVYAAALLMPMLYVMPSPLGTPSAPMNVLLLGLTIAAVRTRPPAGIPSRLPGGISMALVVLTSLVALVIRAGEADVFGPTSEVAVDVWRLSSPFLMYLLVHRYLLSASSDVISKAVLLCQLSLAGEGAITLVERVGGTGRATAHLAEPNRAGAYFAAAAALFLALALLEQRRRWYFVGFLFSVAGVFNSLSRGALVAFSGASALVFSVFFSATRRRVGTKLLIIVAVVSLPFCFHLVLPDRVVERIQFTFGDATGEEAPTEELDASSAQRVLFWKTGWALFLEHPWGYGLATFPQLLAARTGIEKAAHNVYVQTLVERGIQGLMALLALVGAVFVFLGGVFLNGEERFERGLALALMGWWAAHCIAHFFVNPFFNAQITGQFWILMACLAATRARGRRPDAVGLAAGEVPKPSGTDRAGRRVGGRGAPGFRRSARTGRST